MVKDAIKLMATVIVAASIVPAAFAGAGSAQSIPVKMGYFNLNQVKAAFPQSASATSLEERAKDMLRKDVEAGNNQLQEMQKANKPKEEIEKKAQQLQTEVLAKQQALGQLLSNNAAEANRSIASAVAAVAKEKGLDVVIDASGIYAGGDKFATSGEDVTDAVMKRLVPQK